MSRGGYKMVEENLIRRDLEALKEAAKSDPSIVVQTPPPPPRHRKWKEGRIKKGNFLNDTISAVANRIASTYMFFKYGFLLNE